MKDINETVAGLELALASASSMIERLTLERDIARDERAALWDELAESRANDRTAMGYLSAIRDALGFDGDYPALLEYCRSIAKTAAGAEPVVVVRVHKTGGNAGIAWSVVPADNAPMLRDGDELYLSPPSAYAKCHNDGGNCGAGGYCDDCRQPSADAKDAALKLAKETLENLVGVDATERLMMKEAVAVIDAAMQKGDAT